MAQIINAPDVTIETGDIEIGAVELKNATDDTRAKITALSGIVSSDVGLPVTDPISNAALGVTTGAAVVTDANGTIQQYLRGLVKLIVAKIGVTVAAGDDATEGTTTGAAVVTDADGTLQQYLRGLVKLWIGGLAASTNNIGDVDIATQPAMECATVAEYNVTLTTANTEYSQALPANCRKVVFRCRTAFDVRYAWVTGKVATPTAPYQTLRASAEYAIDGIKLAAGTVYLASATAAVVVEMEAWS